MGLSDLRADLGGENPPTVLLGGLFPVGFVSLVASKAGVGKTWFLLKTATAFTTASESLWGAFKKKRECKVLYFAGETGQEIIIQRIQQSAWNYNPRLLSLYSLQSASQANVDLLLSSPLGEKNIETIIKGENPALVIFDTLISFHDADENKSKEMQPIFAKLQRIAKKYQCAIVCSHHLRKTERKRQVIDQDEFIGSSLGVRLAASAFQLVEGPNCILVYNVKSWFEKVSTFGFVITKGELSNKTDLEYIESPLETNKAKKRIEKIATEVEPNVQFTAKDVADELQIDKSYTRAILMNLVQKGQLRVRIDKSLKQPTYYFFRE